MNADGIAAWLLIAAFMTLAISTAVNAPGLYAKRDIGERLQILARHRSRWLANQLLVSGYAVLTAVAFAVLASSVPTTGAGWIPILGAVAITAGAISAIYFVYRQTTDPRGGYSGAYSVPENVTYVLWVAGAVLFGVAFLQSERPDWLGYLTAGAPIVYGVVFIVTRAGFMTPFLLAFIGLVIGIVLLVE